MISILIIGIRPDYLFLYNYSYSSEIFRIIYLLMFSCLESFYEEDRHLIEFIV
jgi:hypothetical protein